MPEMTKLNRTGTLGFLYLVDTNGKRDLGRPREKWEK
jgi:hypothetical protein